MRKICIACVFNFFSFLLARGQDQLPQPRAFLGIDLVVGRHNVHFKTFAHSPGFSFGFKVNAGVYLVNHPDYVGGLQFTLIEGASNNKDRRRLSEEFDLPNKNFDKHIVYKFAMFRSSNVGWFSEFRLSNQVFLYHQIGFGIFGLTENDPLYNFGMHNHLGLLLGNPSDNIRFRIGALHDLTIGNGNPNYTISNLALSLGGIKNF